MWKRNSKSEFYMSHSQLGFALGPLRSSLPIPSGTCITGVVGDHLLTRWMLWLDSTLGLAARRLGYTQIALEHPGVLASLFVPHIVGGRGCDSTRARIGGVIIAGVLSRRFRFAQNRADRVFDQLEECLLIAAERLSSRALGAVRWLAGGARDHPRITAEIPSLPAAINDQQSVGGWPALFGPFWYVRLRLTCGLGSALAAIGFLYAAYMSL
jgi:hypothetical protein